MAENFLGLFLFMNNASYDDSTRSTRVSLVGGNATVNVAGTVAGGIQAIYFPTPPTLSSGASTRLYTDANGALNVREQYAPGYEDNTNNVAKVEQRFSYALVSGASVTVTVKSGAGFLHAISIGSLSAPTIGVFDSLTATSPFIHSFTPGAPISTYIFDESFTTGLTLLVSPGVGAWLNVAYR